VIGSKGRYILASNGRYTCVLVLACISLQKVKVSVWCRYQNMTHVDYKVHIVRYLLADLC